MIMSIFPIMMLLLTIVSFTVISPEQIVETIEETLPFDASGLLDPLLNDVSTHSVALLSGTAIVAIWVAGKAVMGLADGLNTIYRIGQKRNYIMTRIRAAFYTLILIFALLASFLILGLGYGLQGILEERIYLFRIFPAFRTFVPALLMIGILFLLFLLMYIFLPSRRMPALGQIPGAAFSAVSWTVFTYGFSFYIDFSQNMSVIYGSLTTLVVIMLWLYVCMYLLFLGAELNHWFSNPEYFRREDIEA